AQLASPRSQPIHRNHFGIGSRPDRSRALSALAYQRGVPRPVPSELLPLQVLQGRDLWFGPDGSGLREVLRGVLLGDDGLLPSFGFNGACLDGRLYRDNIRGKESATS